MDRMITLIVCGLILCCILWLIIAVVICGRRMTTRWELRNGDPYPLIDKKPSEPKLEKQSSAEKSPKTGRSTPASPHTKSRSTICCSSGASMPKTALTVHSFPALTASSSLVAPYNRSLAARSRVLMMLRPRPVDIFSCCGGGDCSASRGDGVRAARQAAECCLTVSGGTLRAQHERPQRLERGRGSKW